MSLLILPGPQALSPFRIQNLINDLNNAANSTSFIKDIKTCYVNYIDLTQSLTSNEDILLKDLINFTDISSTTNNGNDDLTRILYDSINSDKIVTNLNDNLYLLRIVPRPGTISTWSSKATSIVHNCNDSFKLKINRLERGMAILIKTIPNFPILSILKNDNSLSSIFDKMTQSLYIDNLPNHNSLFFNDLNPRPLINIPIVTSKNKNSLQILSDVNKNLNLSLDIGEINYLLDAFKNLLHRDPTDVELFMFAQVNSEHCRHKIFNADWTIDDKIMPYSLFKMIKNTYNITKKFTISAYSDNAAVIETNNSAYFFNPNPITKEWISIKESIPMLIKVETHNHPTAVSPFPGAATGSGGEIRDEGATGRGSKTKCGLSGYSVSDLLIPNFIQPWELTNIGKPDHIASALEIMIQAPLGSAAFNNEFGRPCINGYFRTLTTIVKDLKGKETIRGYHKPIMLAGGLGTVRPQFALKTNNSITPGACLIVLGGESMLIGLGGGAASSNSHGEGAPELEFASVQRGNPEMERRCQQVIDACVALDTSNPIQSIHDVGAGGLSNALPELVHDNNLGGKFNLRKILSLEPNMSPMELWCNESQERYVLAIAPDNLDLFTKICERERAPFSVVGHATAEERLVLEDPLFNNTPIDLEMSVLFGKPPKMSRVAKTEPLTLSPPDLSTIPSISAAVERVLQLPSVGSKSFLISIGDRSVTGLVDRDQYVGPWQVPVADVGITAASLGPDLITSGEALSSGEKPLNALISAAASAKLSVAESLLNLFAADIKSLQHVKLSANWMSAANHPGEGSKLYEAVQAIGLDLCPELGIAIPVGKDSMSMTRKWDDKEVTSPLSLNITAFAPVNNTSNAWVPVLNKASGNTILVHVDLSGSRKQKALGGSALLQVFNQIGDVSPDVYDASVLRSFLLALIELHKTDIVLAYHDVSDGGLFTTLVEIAFASRSGLDITIDVTSQEEKLTALFNEELGAVFQLNESNFGEFNSILKRNGISSEYISLIGKPDFQTQNIVFSDKNNTVFYKEARATLQTLWSRTSYEIQKLRDNPRTAEEEFSNINDDNDPGLTYSLTFNPRDSIKFVKTLSANAPKVAILREQGVNGQMEMAWCFKTAGFNAIDVTMTDLMTGRFNLDEFVGIAACGGFSYGDVLGAGAGWAKSVLFHEDLRKQFSKFFQERGDTFAFGACNGCQFLSTIKEIIPGCESWPSFERNYSEQYEARVCMVEIEEQRATETRSNVFFDGMSGSKLPIAVAHGEGRASFTSKSDLQNFEQNNLCGLRYINNYGNVTEKFPQNPNGSIHGIAGVISPNGRVLAMMPHPERVSRLEANSWYPEDKYTEWGGYGPWISLFISARKWVG